MVSSAAWLALTKSTASGSQAPMRMALPGTTAVQSARLGFSFTGLTSMA